MGWLEKLTKKVPQQQQGRRNLPSLDVRQIKIPAYWRDSRLAHDGKLPNASIVYGIGAGGLLAFAFYSFFLGNWFTGLFLLLPACALLGFALHFIRYSS